MEPQGHWHWEKGTAVMPGTYHIHGGDDSHRHTTDPDAALKPAADDAAPRKSWSQQSSHDERA